MMMQPKNACKHHPTVKVFKALKKTSSEEQLYQIPIWLRSFEICRDHGESY